MKESINLKHLLHIKVVPGFAIILCLLLLFQNCSSGFEASGTAEFASISSVAPTLTVLNAPAPLTNNRNLSVQISVSVNQVASVSKIICTLDNNPPVDCKDSFSSANLPDGDHMLKVQAVDSFNNPSEPYIALWKVDGTPPIVTFSQMPAAVTGSINTTAAFAANETSTYECSLDAAAFSTCVSPLNLTALSETSHILKVHAKDLAGNISADVTSNFKVDLTAPVLNLVTKPLTPSNSKTATFSFSGTDGGVAIKVFACQLDALTATACNAGTATYNNLTEGAHTFKLTGQDSTGNMSVATTYTFNVDLTLPALPVITTNVTSPTKLTTATFQFSSSDASGLKNYNCQLDAGNVEICPANTAKTYQALTSSSHTFKVQAVDLAGNVSAYASFNFVVDNAPPIITLSQKPVTPTTSTAATFAFTAIDALTSVNSLECQLDAAAFAACTSPKNLTGLALGSHTFTIRATDSAGNQGLSATTWTISNVATPTPTPGPVLTPGVWGNITPPVPQPWANTSAFIFGWTSIDGAKADAPKTLYVVVDHGRDQYSGVWKSTDGGDSWTYPNQGPNGELRQGGFLRVDPTDSNIVYMGIIKSGSGLFKTVNGGASWTQILPNNYEHDVYGLEIDPYNHLHLLLTFHSCQVDWPLVSGGVDGAACGILESLDGGSTWITRRAAGAWTGHSQFAFFVGKKNDGSADSSGGFWIVSNQDGQGIWRTENSGAKWTKVGNFDQTHGMQSLYRSANDALYMGSVGKIFRSLDNGRTWSDTGAQTSGDGYGGIWGDGTHIWAMLANTGTAVFGPHRWQMLSETDSTSSPSDSHWSFFDSATYADGPDRMIYDPVNKVLYSSNWGAGVFRMKLETQNTSGLPQMKLISRTVPVYASGNSASAQQAQDSVTNTSWSSDKIPAWLAYDLSSVPVAERQNILVALYTPRTPGYVNIPVSAGMQIPIDYTIETNMNAGGGQPPTAGWAQMAKVTGNNLSSPQHLVNLSGANWVRIYVTNASDASVALDMDVYSLANATTSAINDSWLLKGDSITHITFGRAFNNLPNLVNKADAKRWPAVIEDAVGGTSTTTALNANDPVSFIDSHLASFPGLYVVLAYGTNDDPNNFQMEAIVKRVLAYGKIPVIPHIPWSDTYALNNRGTMINQQIDALYVKYPQIIKGPDLWAAFFNRTDLIPPGDVHPNGPGRDYLIQLWANFIVTVKAK